MKSKSTEAYEEAYNVLKMKFYELNITIYKAMVITEQEHALYNGFENVFNQQIPHPPYLRHRVTFFYLFRTLKFSFH